MKLNPALLRKYLEEEYSEYASTDEEWILPSFENPHKLKLYINVEKGTGFDFIGGKGYSIFELFHELKGFRKKSDTYDWLKKYRMKHLGKLDLSTTYESKPKEPPLIQRLPFPVGAVPISDDSHPTMRDAVRYLRGRGFDEEDFKKYHLHVGLEPNTDYYRRIIIPFIENGQMIWYQGRALDKNTTLRYKNPKGVSGSMLVFGIDNMDRVAIITEGPFDAMTVGGMAIMGNTMSDWQVGKVIDRKPLGIVVCPDSDSQIDPRTGKIISVGYRGALKSVEKLVERGYPVKNIRIAFIEGGKDLNELGKKKALESIYQSTPLSLATLMKFREKGAESDYLLKTI